MQKRTRTCVGAKGGGSCPGEKTQLKDCNTGVCPSPSKLHSQNANFYIQLCVLKSNILHDKFVSICSFMPCVVNCVWDQWIIGDCSVTCGEGTRTNTRIPKVAAQFGGDECDGTSFSTEKCRDQECPGKICKTAPN